MKKSFFQSFRNHKQAINYIAGSALAGCVCFGLYFEGHTSSQRSEHLQQTVRRGASTFKQLCAGCHSLHYLRYQRLSSDLQLNKQQLSDILGGAPPTTAVWSNAMRSTDAERWFGIAPPDLSLEAQRRSSSWIRGYLNGFYPDPQQASGWNNLQMPHTRMPNVLWFYEDTKDTQKNKTLLEGTSYYMALPYTKASLESTVDDIVVFLEYAADPSVIQRQRIGPWVIVFFVFFTVLLALLTHDYWKKVV